MSDQHYGMPGPGGSMGQCAVCGESFAKGVIMDLCGMPSGITPFTVGRVEGTLYAHDPRCVDALSKAYRSRTNPLWKGIHLPELFHKTLPDGPLKERLGEAIAEGLA